MTRSNLSVAVQESHILVVLRGTCFILKYRKQEAPWLAIEEFGPDDPGASRSIQSGLLGQPPIDASLWQSGGLRPAASSDFIRIASTLSNRSWRIAFASCSSLSRRTSVGFDCSSRMNS
jgi:hypothetical protein